MLTAEAAIDRLEHAGATLMAMPARGCFPAAWPTASLSHLIPAEASLERWPRPHPRAITDMDVAYGWVRLLPWSTNMDVMRRRIVLLRSLIWPQSEREDAHVWTWRRLERALAIDHHTIQRRHAVAIDMIVSRVNALPVPCRRTLGRIYGV